MKVGFWLRAFDSVTVEADADAEAIEKAKVAATAAMASTAHPEHVDFDERREGVIAFIDRVAADGRHPVVADVAFDDDRIHADAATIRADEAPQSRRVVFAYLVPVHVEVEDGLVSGVTVIDETPVTDPTVVEGDASYLAAAVAAADDGQAWPSRQFGY
ncbi:MAG: hypothetical protein ACREFP_17265 [Acetobacteraceae bacterium]